MHILFNLHSIKLQKKNYRSTISKDIYKKTVVDVLFKKYSLRKATKYEIILTLKKYIEKQSELHLKPNCKLIGYVKPRQIFLDALYLLTWFIVAENLL